MLARAVFQRAREVVPPPGVDLRTALREDGGVRSILESAMAYSSNVTYAAIVDVDGIAIAHGFHQLEGQRVSEQEPENLADLLGAGGVQQLRAVFSERT